MKLRLFLITAGLIVASCIGFQIGQLSSGDLEPNAEVQVYRPSTQLPLARSLSKPVIGIASLNKDAYVRAIRDCGGIPVVLPDTDGGPEKIDEYIDLIDGLLMPGGPDIPPSEWGEELHPMTKILDDDRYLFEKAIITAWIERTDKPLLGICLGSQWVNVVHGGSLVQDIPSEFGVNHKGPSHMVTLEPDSRLGKIFGVTEFKVNSFHHQAVGNLGEGLRIVARGTTDEIVEATETTDPNRFLIGVQWHPEKLMPENKLQEKLIRAFIEAAAERPNK